MLNTLHRVFDEGFRVLFLAAALFAVVSIALWEGWLGVHAAGGMVVSTPFAPPPHLWHGHEMIYGYAAAVLGGFFMTAAPSWTGAPAARWPFLTAAALVWFAGRLSVWWSGALDPVFVAVVDLAFLPIIGSKLAAQLLRRPKPQNVMLLGLLAIIWSGNLLTHLEWTGALVDGAYLGLRVGVLGVAALIAVIGGRVAPAFTRNAMIRAGRETDLPREPGLVDRLGILFAIATPLLVALDALPELIGAFALACGLTQGLRLTGWRTAWALRDPLVWSLHLGFAMLAVGYLAYGLARFDLVSEVAALHLLGIGAIGGMTLAVMSRAILGHTGRPLIAPAGMSAAFGLIAASAVVRALGSSLSLDFYNLAVLLSGALWLAAFGVFLVAYWRLLQSPRLNGAGAPG